MEIQVFGNGILGNYAAVTPLTNGLSVIEFPMAAHSYYRKNGEVHQTTKWYSCKRYVKTVNQEFVDKLVKGTKVVFAGSLNYDEYEKEVEGVKVPMRAYYIDIRTLEVQ